ncbi:MAG: cupin domain-containing protein [Pseudomonadota bacterium]
MNDAPLQPITHEPGEGEPNAAFGLKRWFRVRADDVDGAFCVFEEEIPEGEGPPVHIHHEEHELFTVLTGAVRFHCDGVEKTMGAGGTVLIPPGARHAFRGVGPGPSRVTVMLTPGRGEGFFRDVEAEGLVPGRDKARIDEIAEDYALSFVGPPLA